MWVSADRARPPTCSPTGQRSWAYRADMDATTAIRRIQILAGDAAADHDDLAADISDLLGRIGAEDQRVVVRHAYWCMTEVPTQALVLAVGGTGPLRSLAGRGPVTGSCQACGRAVRALTRDAVDEDPPTRCSSCQVAARGTAGRDTDAGSSRRATAVPFGWEFQGAPHAAAPATVPVDAPRRWAEHYPDRTVA